MSTSLVPRPPLPEGTAILAAAEVAALTARHTELTPLVRSSGGAPPGAAGTAFLLAEVDDPEEGAFLAGLLAVARDLRRATHASRDTILGSLMPAGALSMGPAVLDQVHRNATVRRAIADEFGLLTAADVSTVTGSLARNTSALASRLRKEGRIFAVAVDQKLLYPGFQFDAGGRPRSVIARVITGAAPAVGAWPLAVWFVSGNGWLDGARPVDLLDGTGEQHDALVEAAQRLLADASA